MDDDIILDLLRKNLGYRDGERVLIVQQTCHHPPPSEQERFDNSAAVAQALLTVYREHGVNVEHIAYEPTTLMNGVDATTTAYDALRRLGTFDIVIFATAYSLTHTPFRTTLTNTGARIASIPGFKTAYFVRGGPVDVDLDVITARNNAIEEQLRGATHVRITAPGTDVTAAIDHEHIKSTTGQLLTRGSYGNIPGAEVYFPPVHRGDTHGHITIPKGWGGPVPLPCNVRFTIINGAFTNATAQPSTHQPWVDDHIKPILFGDKDYDVVAEIGIGTNHAITPESITRYGWSILLGEKIFGTAHLANGNSKGMGGVNDVPVHVDWVIPEATIHYLHEE